MTYEYVSRRIQRFTLVMSIWPRVYLNTKDNIMYFYRPTIDIEASVVYNKKLILDKVIIESIIVKILKLVKRMRAPIVCLV